MALKFSLQRVPRHGDLQLTCSPRSPLAPRSPAGPLAPYKTQITHVLITTCGNVMLRCTSRFKKIISSGYFSYTLNHNFITSS